MQEKKHVFYLLENKKEKIQNVIQNRPKSKYNVIEPLLLIWLSFHPPT